jgi:hypothetical protein
MSRRSKITNKLSTKLSSDSHAVYTNINRFIANLKTKPKQDMEYFSYNKSASGFRKRRYIKKQGLELTLNLSHSTARDKNIILKNIFSKLADIVTTQHEFF